MERKNLYRVINEEINGFDFLNMDRVRKDTDLDEMLRSKDFQVKLITDICENDNSSMSDIDVIYREEDGWDDDKNDYSYSTEFNFKYKDDIIPIYISVEGNHKFPEDSSIAFFTIDGKKIDFSWIEKNKVLKKKVVNALVNEYKKD